MNAKATPKTVSLNPSVANNQRHPSGPWGKIFLLLFLAAVGYGVYHRLTAEPMGGPGMFGGPQGPIPVDVTEVKEQNLRLWTEFSARLTPVEEAEIRPQVGGRITAVKFAEGAFVRKGQPLFVIDPRTYQASLAQAEAAVAAAVTEVRLRKLELDRARVLIGQKAIAQRVFDERENAYNIALATLKGAEATAQAARVNLDHAYIEAPISGRVGRPELTVGNVVEVGGGQAPMLTSIVDARRLYAEFDVDEATYLQVLADKTQAGKKAEIPVRLSLGNQLPTVEGRLHAFDNAFNTTTGTIRARAVFDNSNGDLIPGLFATVLLGTSKEYPVLTVPEAALGTDQTKKFVYVVDAENKATYRPVKLGAAVDGGLRVVTEGLQAGERIVNSRLQMIRPGAEVQPLVPFEKDGLVKPAEPNAEPAATEATSGSTQAAPAPAPEAGPTDPVAAAKEALAKEAEKQAQPATNPTPSAKAKE